MNNMTETDNLNSAGSSSQMFPQCNYTIDADTRLSLPKSPFVGNEDLVQYLREDFVNQEAVKAHGLQQCQFHFNNLMEHLCCPPLSTCVRINTLKISPAEAKRMLAEYLSEFCRDDMTRIRTSAEYCYSYIVSCQVERWSWRQRRYDSNMEESYGVESCSQSSLRNYKAAEHCRFIVCQHPVISDALLIQSSQSSQFVKPCDKEVIVDLACGIAVLRGSHVYAPGVMSMHPGTESGNQVSVMIDIQGKCLRGAVKPFEGMKLFVGNGTCKISRKELFTTSAIKGIAVAMTETVFTSPSLGNVFPELIFLQNLPSVVCCHVLDPQPGELVLDMCAAPGGKTTHLAALMKNQGKVIAIDKTRAKVEKIEESARRWGTICIEAFVYDSTKICDHTIVADKMDKSEAPGPPPYRPYTFDRILLDTPCSALGQRPQLCNKMTVSQLKSYKFLQRKLFARAVELLKPGGTLVYSTCSLTLEENEGLVFWAMNTFPCLQLSQQKPHIGTYGRLGAGLTYEQLTSLQRFGFCGCLDTNELGSDKLDSNKENHGAELCDTIGFFIAKFVKHNNC